MQPTDDSVLLRQFAENDSDEAFAALVRRHIDLTYSVAVRCVGDPHQAEEVVQAVFITLSRKAAHLRHEQALSSWLFQTTRLTARNFVRSEIRRRRRETEAHMQSVLNDEGSDLGPRIAPMLDDAVAELNEPDRRAILLRFYEGRNLRDVGAALGASEDATQKRLTRALERLREFFARRGVTAGTGALAAALTVHAVEAAPAGLAVTVSTAAALSGSSLVATTTTAAAQALAMTTLQKIAVAAVLVAAVGTGVYQARQAAELRQQVQTLRQQAPAAAGGLLQLRQERDDAVASLAAAREEMDRLKANTAELLRLRGEVTRLRATVSPAPADPTEAAMKSWLGRVSALKQRMAQNPGASIPELELLDETDWLAAVRDQRLDSDEDYRKALSALRATGEHKIVQALQGALRKFAEANQSRFPTELAQLKPYFENASISDAMLQRYEIVPQEAVPNVQVGTDWVITQRAAVDEAYDNKLVIGAHGYGSTTFAQVTRDGIPAHLIPVVTAFKRANPGRETKNVDDLLPYAKTPAQIAALESFRDATEAFKRAHPGQEPEDLSDLRPYLKSR